jgi:hypothetical protein
MALIATHTLTTAGTAPTFAAAAANDTAECGPGIYLEVRNTNAATRTVTITVPGNLVTGDAYPDKVYTVAALTGELRIPLLDVYKDPTTRTAALTWSATADVTRAVVRA